MSEQNNIQPNNQQPQPDQPKDADAQQQQPDQPSSSEGDKAREDFAVTPPPSPYADQLAALGAMPQPAQPYGTAPTFSQPQPAQPYGAPQPYVQSAQPYGAPQPGAQPTQPYGAPQPYVQSAQPYGAPQPGAQPTQPYGAGTAMPHQATQPFGTPQPAQPYNPQGAMPYQQPPYPPVQPPYGQPYGQPLFQPAQLKKKIWPWILGGCLIVFILGLGGCVGCVACSALSDSVSSISSTSNGQYKSDNGNTYNNIIDPSQNDDSSDSLPDSYGLTRELIEEMAQENFGELAGNIVAGRCSPGIYEVGVGKDIAPGFYYLGGSQTAECNFWVFDQIDNAKTYENDKRVVFFGHYFTNLEEGELIVYAAPSDARMYTTNNEPLGVSAPYQSGVYRVGIDIPAGSYRVSIQTEAASGTTYEAGVYVMTDLEFDDDSIVDTKYVIAGGSQTITVTDGQYVELFAATMEPVAQ